MGIECNNMTRHVVKLNLRNPHSLFDYDYDRVAYNNSCLGGKVDSSLLGLKHLSYLDLSMNNFDGIPIPEFIGSLNTLTYLNLSYASFAGKVPTQLGNLSALHYLDLFAYPYSNAYLTLYVDNLHWLSGLTSLEYLDMGYVDLGYAKNDWLQVVGMLPSLLELHLSNCGLDNLPLTLPSVNLTSLSVLDLSFNNFNSSIHQWLFSDNLVKLYLSFNNFHGPIPDALANATSLSVLDLSGNNFNSSIPQWLFSDNLVKLHLSYNHFHGPIPDALANATSLQGQIPRTLGNLCQLKSLDLSYTSVSGGIYDFVDNLSPCAKNSLEMLDLTSTEFTGYLPESIGSLESLRILRLSSNSFWGSIPESISNLSSLEELDVSRNQMDGTIPKSIGKLSKLVKLDLTGNSWEGVLTDAHFCNLTGLKELSIGSRSSTKKSIVFNVTNEWMPPFRLESIMMFGFNLGPKFPIWLQTQKELKELWLSDVGISDTIPNFIWELSSQLHRLDLSQNQIKGRVPKSLSFAQVAEVYLDSNCLEGELPLWSNVSELYLSDNFFSGHIPLEIGNIMWPTLNILDLSNNSLNGIIPLSISRLKNLRRLALSNNQMNGTIPKSIGQLSKLVTLDLHENSWEGILTDAHFCNLTGLKYLSIGLRSSTEKSIVFNVTNEWMPPFRLESILMSDCNVGPTFPVWLQTQKGLKQLKLTNVGILDTIPNFIWGLSSQLHLLDLSHNKIQGRVPKSLSFAHHASVYLDSNYLVGELPLWSNVRSLYLRDNSFFGHIPMEIGNIMWPTLAALDLSNNSLNGMIPSSISSLKNLVLLALSKNHLFGEIPQFWKDLQNLNLVDLSHNSLSGSIPSSMGYLLQLKVLQLSSNDLYGEFPMTLSNCTALESLDLGKNRLSGNVPSWIGDRLSNLSILRLRCNLFSGNISSQLCHLFNLHILDLGDNNFSGFIPQCLGNLRAMMEIEHYPRSGIMVHMELVLKGREFEYLEILNFVKSIDLSRNSLFGKIPEELTNLSRLGTLNLSMNHLTGMIPRKIGSLKLLETVDLSRNQLTGPIPSSISLLTSLNHLNLSYNNLCGRIPTGNQLQTLNESSIYEGNSELCGPPLTMVCPNDEIAHAPSLVHGENQDGDESEDLWFYSGMGLGFATGLWLVCGLLIFKRSWRHAYFQFFDDMKEWILIVATVKVNQLQRKMNLQRKPGF